MNFSALNPHIRFAQTRTAAFSMYAEPSVCYDCRLFYFDNIQGSITIKDKKYNIINKTIIFLPPETEYKLDLLFKENPIFIVLNFDLTTANEHIAKSIGTASKSTFDKSLVPSYELPEELSHPIIRNISQIKHMLIQCTSYFIIKSPYYRENASAILKLCLIELARDDSKMENSQLCKNVLSFIHENYYVTNLTNEDIAEHFNYHPYHLSNIIKEETGKTLHQFLIYYRLKLAKEMLLTSALEISDIAWKCGFCSSAYFTKIFRQNVGITPKEYRKQYKIQSSRY